MARNARILLADNEADFLRFTATLLEKEGYACDCATDGASAVELMRTRRYDAVISDIRMPGNPDLRVVREASELQDGVPVILVTAYPSVGTAKMAVELPVAAYVEKPVEFQDLLTKVRGAIISSYKSGRGEGNCRLGRCGILDWISQGLSEAVEDLRATKPAFKSKRIGRTRAKLETILKKLKSGLH
jgi:DNA-binding NtrC family response regulator